MLDDHQHVLGDNSRCFDGFNNNFSRWKKMSQADELEKLSQLKERGVLTEEEFKAKKAEILTPSGAKAKKSRRLLWAIPLIIIGAAGLLNATGDLAGQSTLQCDSATAKDTLQKAFDQSQFARTMNLSAILISEATEQSREAKSGALSCRASLTLNTTKKALVSYKMELGQNGKFLLTFELMDEAKDAHATPATASITDHIQSAPAQAVPVASCVENFTKTFRKEYGDDVLVGSDMLDEWAAECQKKSPG